MKNTFVILLTLLTYSFSGFCGVVINVAHGGANGYQDISITTDDAGNKIINCAQPGYSVCPYLTSEASKYEKNLKEYADYSALVQIAAASIKHGIVSGKFISANGTYSCEWVADPKDLSTFQIKVSDLK